MHLAVWVEGRGHLMTTKRAFLFLKDIFIYKTETF